MSPSERASSTGQRRFGSSDGTHRDADCKPCQAGKPDVPISRQDRLFDRAVHVGQTMVPPLVLEGQLCVVDAQAMEDRGVQVMDVDGLATML